MKGSRKKKGSQPLTLGGRLSKSETRHIIVQKKIDILQLLRQGADNFTDAHARARTFGTSCPMLPRLARLAQEARAMVEELDAIATAELELEGPLTMADRLRMGPPP